MITNSKIYSILFFSFFTSINISNSATTNVPSTTSGFTPSSTAGIIQPESPKIKSSNLSSPTLTTPPVCVDSGVQGRRCGITAITFCKINPDAINCNTINSK